MNPQRNPIVDVNNFTIDSHNIGKLILFPGLCELNELPICALIVDNKKILSMRYGNIRIARLLEFSSFRYTSHRISSRRWSYWINNYGKLVEK